ncbi:MAG TPA: GGDEF domain-containing protein [Streptosporangiaceae bacterium]|nr:GGDEF domain-containing protein [Streptosporangiaceae bacterium]
MGCSRLSLRARTGGSGIRDWPSLRLRPAAFGYVSAVPLAASAALVVAAARTPVSPGLLAIFLALLLCGLASVEATRRIDEPQGTLIRDLLTVWCLPIAVLLPPFWVLVAPVPLLAFTQWRVHRGVVHRRVFSAAAVGLSYGSASVAFHSLPASVGGISPGSPAHAVRWALAVAVCDIMAWVVNNSLTAAAIKLSDPLASMTGAVFGREAMFGDFVQFCLGVVVTVVVAVNPVLLAFAAPSVLLQRRFMMHAELLSRTRLDPKTGLLNAIEWERQAELEVARSIRNQTPLAIAFVDIDHFKNVNDTYGHLVGDEVLQAITGTFRDHLREYDTAGRFGGEEFAILLPHAAPDDAHGIAERLRAHIASLPVHVRSRPDADGIEVTVSVGVVAFDGSEPRTLADLVAAADAALYQAKQTGRNRVRVATGSGASFGADLAGSAQGGGAGARYGPGCDRGSAAAAGAGSSVGAYAGAVSGPAIGPGTGAAAGSPARSGAHPGGGDDEQTQWVGGSAPAVAQLGGS